jgi:sugar fermentation stimulation protein A
MRYESVIPAVFQARPNRFVAEVLIADKPALCHVKNTGRCRELLIPGVPVWLAKSGNPARKTAYDLITVQKGDLLINLDSQAPNKVFAQWAKAGHFMPGLSLLRPEFTFGTSRFDFYWEAGDRRGLVEVKGVTLEDQGAALFPDAPTQRGVRHLEELRESLQEGYEATVCFVIQMSGVSRFSPNDGTHPQFGAALRRAAAAGVQILALDCVVTPDTLSIANPVPVCL